VVVATWNLQSLPSRLSEGANGPLPLVLSLGAHILCLQETHLRSCDPPPALAPLAPYTRLLACSAKTRHHGVATLTRGDKPTVLLREGEGGDGRLLVTDHGAFVVINAYLPNQPGRRQLNDPEATATARKTMEDNIRRHAELRGRIDALVAELGSRGRHVLIVGDLNALAEPNDYSRAQINTFYDDRGDRVWLVAGPPGLGAWGGARAEGGGAAAATAVGGSLCRAGGAAR
jgi:exonuclease III